MKALVLEEYNSLVLREVPEPEPGDDDVLIRVRSCGICGSDVHGVDGSTGRRVPPIIMGHEAAGTVERAGSAVESFRPGDRVTFDSTVYCGECRFCLDGRVNLCENRRVIGVSCDEYKRDGAFAEYIAVPQRTLYRLPDSLTFDQATTVEPLSVAVHAVDRVTVEEDSAAVVIGAGMIGQLIVQVLKVRGCGRVFCADLQADRLALAGELGADRLINPESEKVAAVVLDETGGRGAVLAFDAVGTGATLSTCLACLDKGGSLVLVGNFSPEVELPLQKTVVRELSIHGSCASAGEYAECLDMLAEQDIRVDRLISAAAPLSEGPAWFARLRDSETGLMKVCLNP